MEQKVEPAIQRVRVWPVPISEIPIRFSGSFGLDGYQLFNIICVAGRNCVLDSIRYQEEEGNRTRYFLDQDGVRIIGALSWESPEFPRTTNTPLKKRIGKLAEALGGHPSFHLNPQPFHCYLLKTTELMYCLLWAGYLL